MLSLDENYRPLNLSLKMFISAGKTYSPLNILSQDLSLTFDVLTQKVVAKSVLHFEMNQSALPIFELKALAPVIKLDNSSITATEVQDPDGQAQTFWALDQEVDPGLQHELEIIYELPSDRLSFVGGGVRLLTHMTDLNPSNFFENWGPVGFEDDAFSLSLNLKVLNSNSHHELFTNGVATAPAPFEWKIEFPNTFTKSSFYVHLTNATDLTVKRFIYAGKENNIPVQIYSEIPSLVDDAVATLPDLFRELEDDYGPYAHPTFTAYMHSGRGGMEYVGATITSLGSLDHELFHSWFARGVMPAEGRSGWIDEALASWRDYSYFQAPSLLTRNATNLANYSPFRKSTANNCYVDGRQLIAELDREFAAFGGMKPLMKLFFERYKNRVITNEEFWNFLNVMTQINVDAYFKRYTLGGVSSVNSQNTDTKHPLPLSKKEILNLR
jgi:hypothetical protein